MSIAIYTLTSELHDERSVGAVTREFLSSLDFKYEFKGDDYSDFGSHSLNLIYVRTGGTEGIFKRLFFQQRADADVRAPRGTAFYLLTSGKSNSLAASMEILSFLRQRGCRGEIVHGRPEYISRRVRLLAQAGEARKRLEGCRLGVIGQPSDWLISSNADREKVKEKLGIELVDVPMSELTVAGTEACPPSVEESLPGAMRIYDKAVVDAHRLQGFTLRCFDLLTSIHNTGCMALARLNAEGVVAGCEGDVPALLTMMITQAMLGVSGFQANPARIDPETGEVLFAHCTIPLNMVERYELDTHFESGIGVGIRGYMKEGPVTVFKVSGDLSRHFIAEGELVRNLSEADLCRTQQVIRLADARQASRFLTDPIGNHHIIMPGHHKDLLEEILNIEQ